MGKIQEWNEAYGFSYWEKVPYEDILFIKKLKEAKFEDNQIEDILNILESTCRHCWDNEHGCQCWNDE